MLKKNHQNEKYKLLDPDPSMAISIASLVVASLGAVTVLINRFENMENIRKRDKQKLRRIIAIAERAVRIAINLETDINEFVRIFNPDVYCKNNYLFSKWELNEYEYNSNKIINKKFAATQNSINNLQNQIGELDLDIVSDDWRRHSINDSQTLLRSLASIDSKADFLLHAKKIKDQSRQYRSNMTDIKKFLNTKLNNS